MAIEILGKTVKCSFTGKEFVAAADGITVNYARTRYNNILSDEGVYLSTLRDALEDETLSCYVSGNKIQGWKGDQVLGTVISKWESQSGYCGKMTYIRARDIFGQLWYGKVNLPFCEAITLRKAKGSKLHSRLSMRIHNNGYGFQHDDKPYSVLEIKEKVYTQADILKCKIEFYTSVLKDDKWYRSNFDKQIAVLEEVIA